MNEMLFNLYELRKDVLSIELHSSIRAKYQPLLMALLTNIEDDINDINDALVLKAENQDNS